MSQMRISRTFSWLVMCAAAAAASPAFAQLHPNLERGFGVDKAFQVGEIDHVNLFNGNVALTIPLGATSTISERLSLGLTATYNSKLWEMRAVAGTATTPSYTHLVPDRLANAGFGWLVSLGRLLGPAESDVNSALDWRYQGADGSIHDFRDKLHPGDAVTAGVRYTTDGTYLRLRQDGAHYFIDFPNGISQEFEPWQDGLIGRWRLLATRDPHGNYYSVDYTVAQEWTIKDQYDRKTIIKFTDTPLPSSGRTYDFKNLSTAVDSITIPGFNGQTAKYVFTYEARDVRRGYCGQAQPPADDKFVAVPLLTTITLYHGTSVVAVYAADYDVSLQPPTEGTASQSCKAGTITSLKLPTQATILWEYGRYYLPGGCRSELTSDWTAGVVKKTYKAADGGEFASDADGVWTYSPALTPEDGTEFDCGTQHFVAPPPPGEMTNTVTSPTGDQTVHYFSVWPLGRADGSHGETKDEFGLPFSRRNASIGATTFISSKICQGSCSSLQNARRTTNVAYERDFNALKQFDANRRLMISETVYNDDSDHVVRERYSDFDGVGHYRTITTEGDFGDGTVTRAVTTAYNVRDANVSTSEDVLNTGTYDSSTGEGFSLPPTDHQWILDTYSSVTSQQGVASRKQYACFDPVTGDLRAARVLAGNIAAAEDLLTVYERSEASAENGSAPGFITKESFFGGDAAPLNTTTASGLCDYVDAIATTDKPRPLSFQVQHAYSYGSRSTSTYFKADGTPMPFKSLHLDIDVSGLASTVYDTADVATDYEYDASGRLTKITPTGTAVINYSYSPATSTVRANVASTQTSTTGTIKRELHFDSMGRAVVEKRTLSSAALHSRTTTYNAMGWKRSVSGWGTTAATTFGGFDAFGRPSTIVAPDGSTTTMSYTGNRTVTQGRTYHSPEGEESTTVTNYNDPFGRLVQVTENSGPTSATSWSGSSVTTTYGYDVSDHLTSVEMTPAGGMPQSREFVYDGRGWLTAETHPELDGALTYTYDALGHVVSKGVSADNALDLEYAYDAAGRLTGVFSRFGGGFRASKNFVFGTSNSDKGRLVKAQRYNYRPGTTEHYLVTEDYAYDDDGRVSSRDTKIEHVDGGATSLVRTFTQARIYNDLGLPATNTYPQCVNCGSPARNLVPTYTRGLLSAIPGFIGGIGYANNGLPSRVDHANGISDVITMPDTGEARPESIMFEGFCVPPQITAQPDDQDVENLVTFTLMVSATGTSPTYQWYSRAASTPVWSMMLGKTAAQLHTAVTEDTYFRLTISNSCGSVTSREVRITVYEGARIDTQPASTSIAAGNSSTLSVVAGGSTPLSYQWFQGTSGNTSQPIAAPAGTQSSFLTPVLWATTSYWVRASNSHNAVNSQTATVTVHLTAPTGVTATRMSDTEIRVIWNGSPGAGRYRVERRSGSGFVLRTVVSAPTVAFSDMTVLTNKTYVYRVVAEDSSGGSASVASNQDLATTIDFASIQSPMSVADDPLEQILTGVNALRSAAASGATPLTWPSLVAPPVPGSGAVIGGSTIDALRGQLNLARGSLGFPNWSFTDSSPSIIKAIHITELQEALR